MTWRGAVRSAGPYIIIHANTLIAMLCGAGCVLCVLGWGAVSAVSAAGLPPLAALLPRGALLLCLLTLTLALVAPYTATPTPRPVLLCLHALCHMCVCVGVGAGAVWAWRESRGALRGLAETARGAGEVRQRLEELLDALARYHTLPKTIKQILQELEKEVPVGEGVAAGGAGLYVLLVVLSVSASITLACVSCKSKKLQVEERRRPCLRPPRDLGPLLPLTPAPP